MMWRSTCSGWIQLTLRTSQWTSQVSFGETAPVDRKALQSMSGNISQMDTLVSRMPMWGRLVPFCRIHHHQPQPHQVVLVAMLVAVDLQKDRINPSAREHQRSSANASLNLRTSVHGRAALCRPLLRPIQRLCRTSPRLRQHLSLHQSHRNPQPQSLPLDAQVLRRRWGARGFVICKTWSTAAKRIANSSRK